MKPFSFRIKSNNYEKLDWSLKVRLCLTKFYIPILFTKPSDFIDRNIKMQFCDRNTRRIENLINYDVYNATETMLTELQS